MHNLPCSPNRNLALMLGGLLLLSACAAGDARFTTEGPAGFWFGLWHGAIAVVTFVIGLFSDKVHMYEELNTGGWYDLGFLLGLIAVWGKGGHSVGCRVRRDRTDRECEEIGRKVEQKVMRRLREWAEAEEDQEWAEVEKKIEQKVKRKIRQWADEP